MMRYHFSRYRIVESDDFHVESLVGEHLRVVAHPGAAAYISEDHDGRLGHSMNFPLPDIRT